MSNTAHNVPLLLKEDNHQASQKSNHCILCPVSSSRIIYRKHQWQYFLCQNCGLVSLHPTPTPHQLMKYYEGYLSDQPEEITKWEMMMKPVVRKSADLIESRSKTDKGTVLDIGCGYGFFLRTMKSRGWKTSGIEISPSGRRYARNKWGINVFPEPIERLQLSADTFDVVTLFYVIEHILEPIDLLKEVKRILKPEGLLMLRWPHSTPIVKLLGPLSKKLDLYHTPYHLYDFSPRTIEKLLSQAGFGRVETTIAGHTLPASRLDRWSSIVFGRLGDLLCHLSGGNILFPGVSKMTLAFKARKW